jgi:hypothetical protein
MEEQDEKSLAPSPKAHLKAHMQAGHPWQKAAALKRRLALSDTEGRQ